MNDINYRYILDNYRFKVPQANADKNEFETKFNNFKVKFVFNEDEIIEEPVAKKIVDFLNSVRLYEGW
jgi:hypothetical protein